MDLKEVDIMPLKINNPADYKVAMYIRLSKEDEDKKEESISFNKHLTKENRTIYLENNIKELYIFDHQSRWTFKYYVTNTNQSLERSLKSVTDLLEKEANLKDGGTAIYKNKDKI